MSIAPSRRAVIGLLRSLWQIGYTGVRTFGWDAVREGSIDLARFGPALRAIGAGSFVLIALFLTGILFSDALRLAGPIELLANDSTATRALLVPQLAVPLTLLGMTVGWSLVLAGAATARPLLRYPALLLYLLLAVAPLASQLVGQLVGLLPPLLAVVLTLAITVLYLLLPRLRWSAALRWTALLALHGALVLLVLNTAVGLFGRFGERLPTTLAQTLVQSLYFFIVPFLLIAGLGWADFGLEVARWTAAAVRRHAAGALLTGLLFGFLLLRLILALRAVAADQPWPALAGAALLLGGLGLIGWLRRGPADELPRAVVVAAAVAVVALQSAVAFGGQLLYVGLSLTPIDPTTDARSAAASAMIVSLSEQIRRWQPLDIAIFGLVLAAYGAWRGRRTLTSFGLVLAWTLLVGWLTKAEQPLAGLAFEHAQVDQLLLLGLLGLALVWWRRGALTAGRALRLLAVAVLFALLNEPGFLDNPFSPLFGFAGVAFLVFGVVWNIVTAGGQFVNRDTPGLSGAGRLLLYLGYVLLSVAVAHWYLASHNLGMQLAQSAMNESGFYKVGLPLIYLAALERGRALVE